MAVENKNVKTTSQKKSEPLKKAPQAKNTASKKVDSVKKEVKKVVSKKESKEQEKILGKNENFAKAVAKNVGIAPRKVRLVLDLIRNQDVKKAKAYLMFTRKAASKAIDKVLLSAISNAVKNNGLNEDKLYVSECYASDGTTIKRTLPRARGSADVIRKRSSHITVFVKERN